MGRLVARHTCSPVRLWAVLLLFMLLSARGVWAEEATIADLAVTNSSHDLLLYFTVAHGFNPELEAGIQNGMPATFNFEVSLAPTSGKDKGVAGLSRTFSHTLTYDTLKEEYRVQRSEQGDVIALADIEEGRRLMLEINGLRVTSLQSLEAGREYLLRVRASLARKTLPLTVQRLLPFWEAWDVETGWSSITFRLEAAGP